MPFDFVPYAANAACPQNSSWTVSEVGYAWARAVRGIDKGDTAAVELTPASNPGKPCHHAHEKSARKDRIPLGDPCESCT